MVDSSEQTSGKQDTAKLQAQQLLDAAKKALLFNRYVFVDCFEGPFTSFITTRFGGNSAAPFDTMNMAYHVGDDPLVVASNRKQVCNDFGFEHLCFMDQHHTNLVMIVDEHNVNQGVFPCDGIVTKVKGVALAVMTADCLPLLLCDEEKEVIGAIHCGWRGIADGIIANAIDKMVELGARREKIIAYMGPAIGPRSFMVGAEVRERFVSQYAPYAEAFVDWVVVNPRAESSSTVALASSAFSLEGTAAVLQGKVTRSAVIKQVKEQNIASNSSDPLTAARGMSSIARLMAMADVEADTTAPTADSSSQAETTPKVEAKNGAESNAATEVKTEAKTGVEAKAESAPMQESKPKSSSLAETLMSPAGVSCASQETSTSTAAAASAGAASPATSGVATSGSAEIPANANAIGSIGYTEVFHDPKFGDISILYLQDKYLCNIYELAVLSLQRAGTSGFVYGGRFDTYAQSSLFYSYRKNNSTGRMASVIAINR